MWIRLLVACLAVGSSFPAHADELTTAPTTATAAEQTVGAWSVEGEIALPASRANCAKWSSSARVHLNHGQHLGFIRQDCTFRVDHVPHGSYIVQIENTDFVFEPIRVDITSKGKMRARKLTILQPNNVNTLQYPLRISARGPSRYFRKREEWRITDMLMSPMVLMLVIPLVVMLILPKMTANDPELKREMENMQMPKVDMPDVGEMMANFFGGGGPAATGASKKKAVTGGAGGGGAHQRRK